MADKKMTLQQARRKIDHAKDILDNMCVYLGDTVDQEQLLTDLNGDKVKWIKDGSHHNSFDRITRRCYRVEDNFLGFNIELKPHHPNAYFNCYEPRLIVREEEPSYGIDLKLIFCLTGGNVTKLYEKVDLEIKLKETNGGL